MPMYALRQNDTYSQGRRTCRPEAREPCNGCTIARESYANTEGNLYAVDREISHVSRFCAFDPNF